MSIWLWYQGNATYGGDSSSIIDQLGESDKDTDIIPIDKQGFLLRRKDGAQVESQVYWGSGRIEF